MGTKLQDFFITFYLAWAAASVINITRFGYADKYLVTLIGALFMAFINWIFRTLIITANRRIENEKHKKED